MVTASGCICLSNVLTARLSGNSVRPAYPGFMVMTTWWSLRAICTPIKFMSVLPITRPSRRTSNCWAITDKTCSRALQEWRQNGSDGKKGVEGLRQRKPNKLFQTGGALTTRAWLGENRELRRKSPGNGGNAQRSWSTACRMVERATESVLCGWDGRENRLVCFIYALLYAELNDMTNGLRIRQHGCSYTR